MNDLHHVVMIQRLIVLTFQNLATRCGKAERLTLKYEGLTAKLSSLNFHIK